MPVGISVGTQAGILNTRIIASYILELLEKCCDIRDHFNDLTEELRKGRENLIIREQALEKMQTTVQTFSETMDKLGVRMLQGNIAGSQRNSQIDHLKREIETLSKHLEDGNEQQEAIAQRKEERLNDIRTHRGKMEMQLVKMKTNIDNTYEDLFETQEKLIALKDFREMKRDAGAVEIAALRDKTSSIIDRKRNILTVTDRDSIDMSQMYVSPTAFAKLEADIETLKRQQTQMERHIQMQLDERAFLRDTANSIIQRVFDLEKKVRKETGDHGWESTLSVEPNLHQEFSTPSVWHSLSPITIDQLKRMQELYFRNFTPARAIRDKNENEAKSGETSDEIIVIDIKDESV